MRSALELAEIDAHTHGAGFVKITNNSSFGQSRQNLGNAYVPRSGQIGFRFSF